MNLNTLNKASPIMKRNGKFLALAAAIGVMLVIHDSGDNDIDVAAASVTSPAAGPAGKTGTVRPERQGAAESADRSWGESLDGLPQLPQSEELVAATTVMGQPSTENGRTTPNFDERSEKEQKSVAPRDKMSGAVAALLAAGNGGDAELVVRYDQRPELFDDEFVAELGGEVVRSYEHLDMRAIRLPVASLEQLASDENVDWLSLDDKMSATSVASRLAANLPASGSTNAGYAGSNVGIAILDTGVSRHSDLGDDIIQYSFLGGAYPTPQIANGEIVSLNDSPREDGFGHGTHVAGVLGGSGEKSNNDFRGSSTGAKLLALQVLDEDGQGSMSDVMAALDWLLTYGSHFDIRVVNLSLGKGISESNQTDPLVLAVEDLWDAGMVVVVAAGNEGLSGSMTVTSPGNSRKVITVGSLTDNATGLDHSDDFVSSFSSQGPTIGDYVLKPDLLAPGNRVVGTAVKNSKLGEMLKSRLKQCKKSGCDPDEIYLEMSGTSMATPIASATVALMLEKDPSLSPATVKARLMRSARKIDADPTESGAGLLDADAALDDSGVIAGEALSPLIIFDEVSDTVLVEDTAVLWGDDLWGAAYLFSDGLNWASGATFTDDSGVTANGYMWTGGKVSAKGYMWTEGGISAKGYMWTNRVAAKSLLDGSDETEYFLNDDEPTQ